MEGGGHPATYNPGEKPDGKQSAVMARGRGLHLVKMIADMRFPEMPNTKILQVTLNIHDI